MFGPERPQKGELLDADGQPLPPRAPARTFMDNEPACGAPTNWPWGYLPCGCRNDGYGRHVGKR